VCDVCRMGGLAPFSVRLCVVESVELVGFVWFCYSNKQLLGNSKKKIGSEFDKSEGCNCNDTFTNWRNDGLKLLGAVIGSDEFVEKFLAKEVNEVYGLSRRNYSSGHDELR
jgi:hypothetical protein